MKTVVLDGFAVNPGDLSWDFLSKYGEYTVYDKTPYERAAEVLRTMKGQIAAMHKMGVYPDALV